MNKIKSREERLQYLYGKNLIDEGQFVTLLLLERKYMQMHPDKWTQVTKILEK